MEVRDLLCHRTVSLTLLLFVSVLLASCDLTGTNEEEPDPDQRCATAEADRRYSDAEIEYFLEIALGTEFGNTTPRVRKWVTNPHILVLGTPTEEDSTELARIIDEINTINQKVTLSIAEGFGDIRIHFVPQSEFGSLEPNYVLGNSGFVYVNWNADGELTRANILIASDISQSFRLHLLREELTQGLGLLRDSFTYPESIFYQGSSEVLAYLPIDRTVIELLYRSEVRTGMTESRVTEALCAIM